MNLALEPFTYEEFLQLRSLMVRLVDHLQSLPAPVATLPAPPGAKRAPRKSSRSRTGRK